MRLNIIKCGVCGNARLVGVDGKDIRKSKKSGGKFKSTPYMAISNEEIAKAPELPEKIDCPTCSAICKVEEMKVK